MNLSYRGIKYSVEPMTAKVVEGDVVGQYRGNTYRLKQAVNTAAAGRQVSGLRYRGAVVR